MEKVLIASKPALEELHRRYFARATGVAYRILQDEDLSQEVAQEAFWRVWQHADQYRNARGTFANWLFGIVRNLAIDEHRRNRTTGLPEDDDALPLPEALTTRENLTDMIAERIRHAELRDALTYLPTSQRQVLELAYWHGLTRREIARSLGEPLGTIHTRALLGMNKLREMVKE